MSKPNYICECGEDFDKDSGVSYGVNECVPCAAWAGTCECNCQCGQCLYTETPCGEPPSEEPCRFCDLREEWRQQFEEEDALAGEEDALAEVRPILSKAALLVTKAKDQLAMPWKLGMVSHDYTQKRLDYRLQPCLDALLMVKDKSAWASAVIDEVKNLLGFEGRSGVRKICGLPDCTCHLRILNALVVEKKGGKHLVLEGQIIAAEDARHAARNACVDAMQVWDNEKFDLRIADEMLEEFKWETGMILKSEWEAEMKTLSAAVAGARAKATAAGEAYAAVGRATEKPAAEFHRLIQLKKALNVV